jgi:hypothetical protein
MGDPFETPTLTGPQGSGGDTVPRPEFEAEKAIQRYKEENAKKIAEVEAATAQAVKRAERYVETQVNRIRDNAIFLNNVISIAMRDYQLIRELKDKPAFNVTGLLWDIATIVVPKGAEKVLQLLADSNGLKKVVAKVAQDLNDWSGVAKDVRSQLNAKGSDTYDPAGVVLAKLADKSNNRLALASWTDERMRGRFKDGKNDKKSWIPGWIEINAGPTVDRRVIEIWKDFAEEESAEALMKMAFVSGTTQLMSDRLLYDMIRSFAERYCKFFFRSDHHADGDSTRSPGESGLEGLSRASLAELYKKYGYAWLALGYDTARPPLLSYRDLITHWEITLFERDFGFFSEKPPIRFGKLKRAWALKNW